MENLILTTTFSGPPTLLHLPHKFTNIKKPNPGFILTRDAKWLKCVTFFPVSVCAFILFLHQDFQGKQQWLICRHFQRLHVGLSLRAQASGIRGAPAPPCCEPHVNQRNAPRSISVNSADYTYNALFWNKGSVLEVLQMNKSDIRNTKHL